MKHYKLICFFLFIITGLVWPEKYSIGPASSWVQPYDVQTIKNVQSVDSEYGTYLLLLQKEVILVSDETETYYHYASKITNESGLHTGAQINIEFDPAYQRLILHEVQVFRGEEVLKPDIFKNFSILHREKELEYQLLDGRKTCNIILEDIRVGDIVEYSYTLAGDNPVFNGKYSGTFYLNWYSPIHKILYNITASPDRKINTASTGFELNTVKGNMRYTLELTGVDPPKIEDNLPGWYNPFKMITVSEFKNWEEVIQWALLYYKGKAVDPAVKKKTGEITGDLNNIEDKISALLKFTQKEIRYLGIEMGSSSHAPSPPGEVLTRRFGDCKDKSMLLINMFSSLGITAYPALVNTYRGKFLNTDQPSPLSFNHVIVYAKIKEQEYWFDPTITFQEASLQSIKHDDFGYVLIINEEEKSPVRMDTNQVGAYLETITETFDLSKGFKKTASLHVKTLYEEDAAIYMRSHITQTGKSNFSGDLLNFYAKEYPAITRKNEIHIEEDIKNNRIIMNEQYEISDIWDISEDSDYHITDFYPTVLASYLRKPETIQRKMPYALRYPMKIKHTIKVKLPEPFSWDLPDDSVKVNNSSFEYRYRSSYTRTTGILTLEYTYSTKKDYIEAKDTGIFLKDLKKISNSLAYSIQYGISNSNQSSHSSKKSGKDFNIGAIIVVCFMALAIMGAMIVRSDPFQNAIKKRIDKEDKRTSKQKKNPFHVCSKCGITDISHPDMSFRICDDCEKGYCMDHINDHNCRL